MNLIPPIILVILLCIGLGYSVDATVTARSERDEIAAQLTAEKLRTSRLQRSVLAATAKAKAAEHSLKEALDAAPEFRDTAVPVPVRDSLCGTLRCK